MISADLALRPGQGAYPDLDLKLQDTGGGLKVGQTSFSAVSADLTIRKDVLNIAKLSLSSGASSFSAGGKLSPALLTPSPDGKSSGRLPLDFWVKAEKFSFADIRPLMPKPAKGEKVIVLPDGVVSCDLTVGGGSTAPQLSGPLSFQLASLPLELPLGVDSLSGQLLLTKNNFDIQKMSVASGSDPQLAQMAITGSGGIKFNPFGLSPAAASISTSAPAAITIRRKRAATCPLKHAGRPGHPERLAGQRQRAALGAQRQPERNRAQGQLIYTYRPPSSKQQQSAAPVRSRT